MIALHAPFTLLTLACSGGPQQTEPAGTQSVDPWLLPWADQLIYREVSYDDITGGVDTDIPDETSGDDTGEDGGDDTGQSGGSTTVLDLFAGVTDLEDGTWTWELRRGDSYASGTALLTVVFGASEGLQLVSTGETVYDPAILLVEESFQYGDTVETGEWSSKSSYHAEVDTWYGQFPELLQVRVEGPEGGEAEGLMRFGAGVGLVQFSWDNVSGDLGGYE